MEPNILELRNILALSGKNFYIPDYQRGYRWTATEITNLLDDLSEFSQNVIDKKIGDGGFYCLQPVVARRQSWKDKNGETIDGYEIIDGQQRLTTIYLLLKYFAEPLQWNNPSFKRFSISYQTRQGEYDSREFLENIDKPASDANAYIDFYYMKKGWEIINAWFEKNGDAKRKAILDVLTGESIQTGGQDAAHNVRIIWYELADADDSDAIDIFTRLNIGKIPLTNAELVKALLLRRNDNNSPISTMQLEISRGWDEIEQKLQDDKFWHFLRKSNAGDYDTRIEFMLDLLKKRGNDSEPYHTFNEFNKDYRELEKKYRIDAANDPSINPSEKAIEDIWRKIRDTFRSLEEMYEDRCLYHRIGFLVETGSDLMAILTMYESEKKDEFKKFINSEIKVWLNYNSPDIDNLVFNEGPVREVLLLFNILLTEGNMEARFPFDTYKKEAWDVEHITSRAGEDISSVVDIDALISELLLYFVNSTDPVEARQFLQDHATELQNPEKISDFVNKLLEIQALSANPQKNKDAIHVAFTALHSQIQEYFGESAEGDIDGIGNLALLDASTNRSYKNAYFPVKRACIITKDEAGGFVPLGTKNAFFKYFTPRAIDLMRWRKEDADNYCEAIKQTLNIILE